MNTFTDLPASHKCPRYNGGDSVMDAMMGLQQSFAGAMMPVA
jgi:hypothetical protein